MSNKPTISSFTEMDSILSGDTTKLSLPSFRKRKEGSLPATEQPRPLSPKLQAIIDEVKAESDTREMERKVANDAADLKILKGLWWTLVLAVATGVGIYLSDITIPLFGALAATGALILLVLGTLGYNRLSRKK
jgi:hypothetical protein